MNQTKDLGIVNHLKQFRSNTNYHAPFLSYGLQQKDYGMNPTIKHEIFQNYLNIIPNNAKIIAGTSTSLNNNDTISITYPFNNHTMFNCMKIVAPINQMVECILFITENHDLACANLKEHEINYNQFDVIVEGVEAMRIRYGEDTNNDGIANRYVAADYPGLSLARVVNIKMSLLLRTTEKINLMVDSKYYLLQDVELGPFNDHYLRKVYTITLPIRGLTDGQADKDNNGVK